jgi:hypothetical protein
MRSLAENLFKSINWGSQHLIDNRSRGNTAKFLLLAHVGRRRAAAKAYN